MLTLLLLTLLLCTGCEDMVRANAKLLGYKGDPYAGPCAPVNLKAGYCGTAERLHQ